MSRRIPAEQAETFMQARARRYRKQRRDGSVLLCIHVDDQDKVCSRLATHVAVEGLRCADHLEGTNYATKIARE